LAASRWVRRARLGVPRSMIAGSRFAVGSDVKITTRLFKLARLSATASALASGNPKRIARRAKNIAVGKVLARAGFWRRLWK
jgi:hypothetical protein